MEGYIHSTESYGTVDGPGTRFVIFFQGCPMRCQYCHNPDTWTYNINEKRTVESLLHDYDGLKEFYHDGGITATLLKIPSAPAVRHSMWPDILLCPAFPTDPDSSFPASVSVLCCRGPS